ncbi:hypothetical protein BJ165DRAFT_1530731 [Panaeolus papilionaceus]|nr:hypothetical protein BJ165DRAFT_1530731 [Panaeolus papilionaceus]
MADGELRVSFCKLQRPNPLCRAPVNLNTPLQRPNGAFTLDKEASSQGFDNGATSR